MLQKMKLNVLFRCSNKIRKCIICHDVYIGETKLHLLFHQYEHLGRSILTEKPLKYNVKDTTAVRKHCHQQNHPTDSFCFFLIGIATNNYHLRLKQSPLISKFKLSLNITKESMLYIYLKTIHSLLLWI